MNHLVGLDVPDPTVDLSVDEKKRLDSFRKLHESDGAELKRPDPPPLPPSSSSDLRVLTTPRFEVSTSDLPHPDGWRPLDDCTLYRFLSADRDNKGKLDESVSIERLRKALAWRKQNEADEVLLSPPSNVAQYRRLRPGAWVGLDREGRPAHFERLGEFFSSGSRSLLTDEEWMKLYTWDLEVHFLQMREASIKTGKPIHRFTYFADFQGVVSSIVTGKIWDVVPLLKKLVKEVECHYPEIVDHITLFNVPRIASAVYAVVKRFIDPVTASKIDLHAGVPHSRLRKLLPEDVIPKEYGGTNEVEYPHHSKV